MSVGEHDESRAEDRLGSDDGARMDDRAGEESTREHLPGEAPTDRPVPDPDHELRIFRGVLGLEHRQSPAARSRPPLVEKGGSFLAPGEERVEGLATEAAGTGAVERHRAQGEDFVDETSTTDSAPWPAPNRRRAVQFAAAFDLVGVGLVAAFAAWVTFVGLLIGGDPIPTLAVAGAWLATFGFVSAISLRIPWFGPVAVLVAGALLPFLSVGGTAPTGQRFGPLQYANATALFYVVVAAAGGMLAANAEGRFVRLMGLLALLAAAATVAASRSEAAIGLLLLLPVAALARRPAAVRWFLFSCAVLVLAAVATTILLGTLHATDAGPETVQELASRALTERRLDLWRDALHIAAREPATGVGPGEFRSHSPTALRDSDAVAVHDEYLQAAAELGLPGLILAVSLILWGFVRLRWTRLDPGTSFAGAAIAAVGIHASLDYALHAPAIVVALAALVGAGSAPLPRTDPAIDAGPIRGEGPGVATELVGPVSTAARTPQRGSQ